MDDSQIQSKDHFDKLNTIGEQNGIPMYHVTLMYASLLKLFRSAMRLSSLKQEVITYSLYFCQTQSKFLD